MNSATFPFLSIVAKPIISVRVDKSETVFQQNNTELPNAPLNKIKCKCFHSFTFGPLSFKMIWVSSWPDGPHLISGSTWHTGREAAGQ